MQRSLVQSWNQAIFLQKKKKYYYKKNSRTCPSLLSIEMHIRCNFSQLMHEDFIMYDYIGRGDAGRGRGKWNVASEIWQKKISRPRPSLLSIDTHIWRNVSQLSHDIIIIYDYIRRGDAGRGRGKSETSQLIVVGNGYENFYETLSFTRHLQCPSMLP